MDNKISWIINVTGGDSNNAVAVRAGLTPSTLLRQIKNNAVTAETVIAIARAYTGNPVRGLVDTGFITAEEADTISADDALNGISDEELIAEMSERLLSSREKHPDFLKPLKPVRRTR